GTTLRPEVSIQQTAILGAGGWGTALAILWAKRGNEVILWGNDAGRATKLRETRENADYLAGVKVPDSVQVTSEISDCAGAGLIVFVTPSTALRSVAARLHDALANSKPIFLSGTKGIEHGTGLRMSEI